MGLKDLLFGKKSPEYAPSRVRTIDAEAKKTGDVGQQGLRSGFEQLQSAISGYDPSQAIRYGNAQRINSLGAQGQDLRRSLQSKIASRGLGGSSVGLNQERAIEADIAARKGNVFASLPGQLEESKLRKADAIQRLISGGATLANAGKGATIFEKGSTSKRGGGLFKLANQAGGAIVGGIFGGPGGAAGGERAGAATGDFAADYYS